MNILVVVAHPDDEVLGLGGLIARYTEEGANVYVHLLTHGRLPTVHPGTPPNCCLESAQILGIRDVFVDHFELFGLDNLPLVDIAQSIEKYAASIQPEIVLTHHRGDINQDHQVAHQAVMVAMRPGGLLRTIRSVLTFEIASSTEWGTIAQQIPFVPNVFLDITKTLEKKLLALGCYQSEMREYPHPRSFEYVKHLAGVRGATVGYMAAEAFTLVRDIDYFEHILK